MTCLSVHQKLAHTLGIYDSATSDAKPSNKFILAIIMCFVVGTLVLGMLSCVLFVLQFANWNSTLTNLYILMGFFVASSNYVTFLLLKKSVMDVIDKVRTITEKSMFDQFLPNIYKKNNEFI